MTEAFICDAIRTPVGRYNGGLAPVRVDDLAAHPREESPGTTPCEAYRLTQAKREAWLRIERANREQLKGE